MNTLLQENFEYRHKKFDQCNRSRTDSWSSSSSRANEHLSYIKVENEKTEEFSYLQTYLDDNSALNLSIKESKFENSLVSINQEKFLLLPEEKKLSLDSFSPGLKRNSSTPLSALAATVAVASPSADALNQRSYSKRSFKSANQDEVILVPEAKRFRLDSVSSGSSKTSIPPASPLPTLAAAAVIPPTAAILPTISDETILNICKYHGNMVRKFPKKERTPKDQERRNKNTIACRMSRRVKKLEHIAIEEQYKQFSKQTFNIIEQTLRATAYLQELMKLSDNAATTTKEEIPRETIKLESPSPSGSEKKPFTIAFLTGEE